MLRRVYEGFDDLLIPVYEKIGRGEGRQPRHRLGWAHVAAAMTEWTEGLAMRYHYEKDGERQTPWQPADDGMDFVIAGADALWYGLTEPLEGV